MIIDLDQKYRILENDFGYFLQIRRRKVRWDAKPLWRTLNRFNDLQEAVESYYKILGRVT